MKKTYLVLVLLLCGLNIQAQRVIPFVDFSNYFKSFNNGMFNIIEMQKISEYNAGDELVAYIDFRGNLRVYDGTTRQDISNMNVSYSVSDHLMAYNVGTGLNIWDQGKVKLVNINAGDYLVKDSIVVFEDTRYMTVNAYYNKQIYPLYTVTGDLYMPVATGDNIVAFQDNSGFFRIFWRGAIYDLGVWNGTIDFKAGTDIVCMNDPTTRTFAAFENGEFVDVEPFWIDSYKAGRNFVVYTDRNGNLIYYKNGEKQQISNYSSTFYEVTDDLVVWGENNRIYAFQNGKKVEICAYTPADYLLKNNTFVFRNSMGGVSALMSDGKIYEITTLSNSEYEIYGNSVLVKLFNNSVIVFQNGKKFEN